MASLAGRLVSWLFYLSWHVRAVNWVIALALAWWGWVVFDTHPDRAWLLWGSTLGFLIVAAVAWACSYLLFRRDGRQVEQPWGSMPAVVFGQATGYFTESNGLGRSPVFGFNKPVQVRWQREFRPPYLLVIGAEETRYDPVRHTQGIYAEWYPESRVETVWFWSAGRECYGLRLYFAGRWLLLELDEADAAAIRQLLVG